MAESRLSQHMVQVLHTGLIGESRISQHVVQALTTIPAIEGVIRFQTSDCTNLYSKGDLNNVTESGLSWAVLDSSDASAVTSILDQNNNLNIVNGTGVIETTLDPGEYIVIVQNGTGSIGAYVMNAV